MSKPYLTRYPGDRITADDWNAVQTQARDELASAMEEIRALRAELSDLKSKLGLIESTLSADTSTLSLKGGLELEGASISSAVWDGTGMSESDWYHPVLQFSANGGYVIPLPALKVSLKQRSFVHLSAGFAIKINAGYGCGVLAQLVLVTSKGTWSTWQLGSKLATGLSGASGSGLSVVGTPVSESGYWEATTLTEFVELAAGDYSVQLAFSQRNTGIGNTHRLMGMNIRALTLPIRSSS